MELTIYCSPISPALPTPVAKNKVRHHLSTESSLLEVLMRLI
ncbi:MAG: hypothetical protein ACM37W_03190 [Actinomycetota bacterium]